MRACLMALAWDAGAAPQVRETACYHRLALDPASDFLRTLKNLLKIVTPSDRPRDSTPDSSPCHDGSPASAPLPQRIRLLVVEASELDYEVLLQALRRQGFEPDCVRVDTARAFEEALNRGHWDAVISDHHLPRFSGTQALSLVRSGGSRLPFIIISASIGEEVAVQAMQAGADDFLVKGKLARLGTALRKAVAAAAVRLEHEQARQALAESERQLRALADHLQVALEAERAAIAREVHDDVGGMLTALRFDLDWIERHASEAVSARARQGLHTLEQASAAVQRLLRNLRPPALDAGLVAALEALVEQFRSRTGLKAQLRTNRDRIDLPEAAAITVYRVAQESLTNVAKHAHASQVGLDLMVQDDVLSLEIIDDGVGLEPGDPAKEGSFGLRGLQERVRHAGGWVDIPVGLGHGLVMLTLPLSESAVSKLAQEIEGATLMPMAAGGLK